MMELKIEATYSVEDNSLRLYPSERLERDLFLRFKAMGFRSAPKQGLFVAKRWTPDREDFCIEMAGEITAEQSTMVERAEAKAARLDGIATKRAVDSNAFYHAAREIGRRFEGGQPILVDHHSGRRAQRDKERMTRAMDKSVELSKSIQYWNWRAEGVERHANQKANPRTRANRIKALLKELRDCQRGLNHARICVDIWTSVSQIERADELHKAALTYTGGNIETGSVSRYEDYNRLTNGEIEAPQLVDELIDRWTDAAESHKTQRWIQHILNRLAYERNELGEVPLFEGELTAVMLQAFAREQGAHKPKATVRDRWIHLGSSVPLPAHISTEKTLEMGATQWKELMRDSGYEVVVKERRKSTKKTVPLINPTLADAEKLQALWNAEARVKQAGRGYGELKCREALQTTQAKYSYFGGAASSPFSTVELDEYGNRIWRRNVWSRGTGESDTTPVCRIRAFTGGDGRSLYAPAAIVVITDKPQKALPVSFDIAAGEVQA